MHTNHRRINRQSPSKSRSRWLTWGYRPKEFRRYQEGSFRAQVRARMHFEEYDLIPFRSPGSTGEVTLSLIWY